MRWIAAYVGTGTVALYIVLTLGVNLYSWHGPLVRTIVRFVPVPVATIGWQVVWASDVLEQRAALAIFNDYQASQQIPAADTTSDVMAAALTKTMKDLVIQRLVDSRELKITDQDVDAAFTTLVGQGTSDDEVKKNLEDLYGWTTDEFKKFVISQDLARDRLRESYAFDDALTADLKKQIDAVRAEISADGANFAELATKYSQDDYGASGGDIGFVPRGALVKELDDVAFSLELNQVSDVIRTKYGFHIIQAIERQGEGESLETKLRSIFIAAPSVDEATIKYLADRKIRILLKAVKWDSQLAAAVVR